MILSKFHLFISFFHYLSLKKIYNFISLYFSYIFSVRTVWGNKLKSPFFLSVEPANFCNLRCPECPVGLRFESMLPKEYLDEKDFNKLIEEQKSTLMHIIFYFQGEPLLNKDTPGLIKKAHDAGIYTSSSTNAQTLTTTLAKELVASRLDKLIVSVDGDTQEVYESYRIGGKLEKALTGIHHIIDAKKELGSSTPYIEMQCLLLKTNEDNLQNIKNMGKNLGVDKVIFKTAQLYDFQHGHPLMPENEKYSRYTRQENGEYQLKNSLKNHCWRLWSGAVVNVHGEVLPCCFDKDSTYVFGNIHQQTFNECWHSEKANAFRMKVLKKRASIDICQNCTSR